MKVRTKIRFLLVTLVTILLAACNKEDPSIPEYVVGGKGEVELNLIGSGNRATSTIEDSESESSISSVKIYVFDKLGGFVKEYNSNGQAGNVHKFIIPRTDNSMNFLAAINSDVEDNSELNYNGIRKQLSDAMSLTNTNSRSGHAANNFAMGGWRTAVDIKGTTAQTDEDGDVVIPITLEVKRLISKVYAPAVSASLVVDITEDKLENLVPGADIDTIYVDSLKITDYVLVNGINKSDAFFTWNSKGDWADYSNFNKWTEWSTLGKSWWQSEFDADGFYSATPYGGSSIASNGYFIEIPPNPSDSVVYVYENKPQDDSVNIALYDKNTVYSYVVRGTINITRKDSNGQEVKEAFQRYWRVNLLGDNSHHIRRNAIYEVRITKVSGIGYGTPKEAEKEDVTKDNYGTVLATLKVLPWNLDISDTNL